jgi:glutamyl-tRNA reductase
MMPNLLARLRRWWRGERRHVPRQNAERVRVVNRQYAVATKLARRLGTTPEALLDYKRADRILGGHR